MDILARCKKLGIESPSAGPRGGRCSPGVTVGLDNVKRIVRLTGYVNSAHGFTKQGAVIEAASHLLYQIFGELGLHARTSFGVTELPGDSACEIELIAQVAI